MADTAEVQKALEDIRRETIESRNMTIKTDNALKTLHAELKSVVTQQEAFQKRTWFATGAAYLAFAVLAALGAAMISGARASSLEADRDKLEKQLKEANAALEAQKTEAGQQLALERAAADVYRMMTTLSGDERLKGVDAMARLDHAKLSPFVRQVLQDRAAQLKQEVGGQILERGRAAFRKQDWPNTISELSRYLALSGESPEATEALFFLGDAYFQSKQYADAEKQLARVVELDKKAKQRDFAMMLLVQSNDLTGNKDKAAALAKEALGTYPSSEFRSFFSNRVARAGGNTPAAENKPPADAPLKKPAPAGPVLTPKPAPPKPAIVPATGGAVKPPATTPGAKPAPAPAKPTP